MAQTMTKRIPVSEQRWKQIGQLKQAGQSYDELLAAIVQAYNRQTLAQHAAARRSTPRASDVPHTA